MYDEERPYEVIEPPNADQRKANWGMSSGLQAVDGLEVSPYAAALAERYIAGDCTSHELKAEVESYHSGSISEQAEADIVAARINELIESSGRARFDINKETLKGVHRVLFEGVFANPNWAGQFRSEGIYKREPVLGGRTVEYVEAPLIESHLDHDLGPERQYDYHRGTGRENLDHIIDIIANIWQVHPFREGNTRTVAVVSQLKLRSLGYKVDNELFKDNSVWFRDALVRASYASIPEGIAEDRSFLRMFYDNLVFGAEHDLSCVDLNLHGLRADQSVPYREFRQTQQQESWKDKKKRMVRVKVLKNISRIKPKLPQGK